MKRQKNKPKGKASKNSKEAMTLVDCYYIPTAIAEHFCLLREHCATEVEQTLLQHFAKVQREQREDIGEAAFSDSIADRGVTDGQAPRGRRKR